VQELPVLLEERDVYKLNATYFKNKLQAAIKGLILCFLFLKFVVGSGKKTAMVLCADNDDPGISAANEELDKWTSKLRDNSRRLTEVRRARRAPAVSPLAGHHSCPLQPTALMHVC
jgi:hypothetical protein